MIEALGKNALPSIDRVGSYQFSVFDLTVHGIEQRDENDNVTIIDLNDPLLSIGDSIEINYDLLIREYIPLEQFGPERELIFSIGGEEVVMQVGESNVASFTDLITQTDFQTEDFLMLQLYTNHDAANVLWEFAFKVIDIDIDSDNNNGFDLPDRSEEEDRIESIKGDDRYPGKLLHVHTGDSDFDEIPDFADFTLSKVFVPMVVEVPEYIDINTAKIRIHYDGSNPAQLSQQTDPSGNAIYVPAPGHLRLWAKNGPESRNINSIVSGGDYVSPGQVTPVQLLLKQDTREAHLYLEAVRESSDIADQSIRVELLPDA